MEEIDKIREETKSIFASENYSQALKNYLQAVELSRTLDSKIFLKNRLYTLISNVALCQFNLGFYLDAEKSALECIKLLETFEIEDFFKPHLTLVKSIYFQGDSPRAKYLLKSYRKRFQETNVGKLFEDLHLKRRIREFELERVLGHGNFTTIQICREKSSGRLFALKSASIDLLRRKYYREAVDMEIHILSRLKKYQNHYIPDFFWDFESDGEVFIIMEFLGGELWSVLKICGSLNEEVTKFYMLQIGSGLQFLHEKQICHRDLKAENVMLVDRHRLKLIDFGTARDFDHPEVVPFSPGKQRQKLRQRVAEKDGPLPFEHYIGTPQFMSPEAIHNTENDFISDFWSLGCLFYQILLGMPPFHAASEYLVFQKIINFDLEWSHGISESAQNLCLSLIEPDRTKRRNLESLASHPYFGLKNCEILENAVIQSSPRKQNSLSAYCIFKISQIYQAYETNSRDGGWVGEIRQLERKTIDEIRFLSENSKDALRRIITSAHCFRQAKPYNPENDGWTVLN